MKETSDYNKVYALVVGKFTASYESSVKADYLKLKFDSKGA